MTKHAKLDGLRIHDLRHTFASVGAGMNIGLPMIGKLLGHAQAHTTERYAHLAVDPVRRSADMIAGQDRSGYVRQGDGQRRAVQALTPSVRPTS